MRKNTMSFWSKIMGKKKNGCCGVVVEEVDSTEPIQKPAGNQKPKCCAEETSADSTSADK
jgi:hypothetical protein